jgi:uncharacterized protein (TIGR00266 family)
MTSHEIEYTITGNDIQIVEIELDSGETVIAEAGAMLYMEDDITFETKMGDGSQPSQNFMGKLLMAGSRLLSGESLFLTHFTNKGSRSSKVAFSAPYPGTIIPLNLAQLKDNQVIAQRESFLCAALGTKMSVFFNKKLGTGFFGGEGFILEKLQGDGFAFIHAGGTVIEKKLNNETLRVDTGCIIAFESSIKFSIQKSGSLRSMIFGGEGIFLATLQGTGRVWIQSMPISKLIQVLSPLGNNTTKETGILRGLLDD